MFCYREYIQINLYLEIQKKARFSSDLLGALQVGLEPTTYGLTVRRSNQLSY